MGVWAGCGRARWGNRGADLWVRRDVIGNNEKRGKRTTLLDAPRDGNKTGGGAAEKGGHLDVLEGTADKMEEPVREGSLVEDLEDPGVVDRVKRFGRIKKENEPLGIVSDALEEEIVEVFDVGIAVDASEEALLGRIKESGDGRHNGARNGAGQETVVCVGDTDRTGVRDQTSIFLGEQEQETVIKT